MADPLHARPPRLLVATVLREESAHLMARWQARLVLQETSDLWDVLVVETTPQPSSDYWGRLSHWLQSWPFGPGHKVRLLRCPDGNPWEAAEAKYERWSSYDRIVGIPLDQAVDGRYLARATKPF